MTPEDDARQEAQVWEDQFYQSTEEGVRAVLNIGNTLWAVKSSMRYGEWQATCKDLRYSRQTAFRLMAIARHHIISDVTHVQHLPPHWGTLYELTKIPDDELEDLLESGIITPDTQRADVVALRHYDWPEQPDDLPIHPRTLPHTVIPPNYTPNGISKAPGMSPPALVFLATPTARKLAVAWQVCKGDETQWLDAAGIMRQSEAHAVALCRALRISNICRDGGITDDLALRYIGVHTIKPIWKQLRRNEKSSK